MRCVKRYIPGMANPAIIQWVEMVLKERGWNQPALAKAISPALNKELDRSVINKIMLGKRDLSADEMLAIEAAAGIPIPNDQARIFRPIAVPHISWVSAGNLAAADGIGRAEIKDAPRISLPGLAPDGEWIALTVKGDSMDKVSPPDSVIFVNLKDRRLVENACYVIAEETGEATYKRYRKGVFGPASMNKKLKPIKPKSGVAIHIIGRVRRSLLSM